MKRVKAQRQFEISVRLGRRELEELRLDVRALAKRFGVEIKEFRLVSAEEETRATRDDGAG